MRNVSRFVARMTWVVMDMDGDTVRLTGYSVDEDDGRDMELDHEIVYESRKWSERAGMKGPAPTDTETASPSDRELSSSGSGKLLNGPLRKSSLASLSIPEMPLPKRRPSTNQPPEPKPPDFEKQPN